MSEPIDLLGLFLHLAQASLRRNRPQVRDRFLVLAAAIAARMELASVAAYCRHLVLDHNPGHMLRRWPTVAAALADSDFLHLLKQLQRRYPQENAEQLLSDLGIEMASERNVYYNDEEYAAALLQTSPAELRAALDAPDDSHQ